MSYICRDKKNPDFYLERGYANNLIDSENYANIAIKLNKTNKKYTVVDVVGKEKVHDLKSKNCSLNKKTAMARIGNEREYVEWKQSVGRKGTKWNEIKYWTSKGLSTEDSKKKITELGKSQSVRCVDFWLRKGLTDAEAHEQIKKIQTVWSKTVLIKKYGESVALKILEDKKLTSIFNCNFWMRKGYSEEAAREMLSEFQSALSKRQRASKYHWIDLGYTEKAALDIAKKYARKRSHWSYEYWMDKGYSENDARNQVIKVQSKNGKLAIKRFFTLGKNNVPCSQIEQDFIDYLSLKLVPIESHARLMLNDTLIFPDIKIKNIIVEIYGDFWHCNPNIYSETFIHPVLKKSAKEIRERDLVREKLLTNNGYIVLIIWETDLKNNGFEYYFKELLSHMGDIYEIVK